MARIGVPTTIRGTFQGTARAFQASLASQPWLILAALLTVYIVLGVLYESFVHPITILSTLPSAGVGALLALLLFETEFSIIAFIGVILLIGIVKKNAIMMIDFALDAERDARPVARATRSSRPACVRFRPIMMTTMAALLGALPLALGAGDGAEMRRPLGIAIVGGLVLSASCSRSTRRRSSICTSTASACGPTRASRRRGRAAPALAAADHDADERLAYLVLAAVAARPRRLHGRSRLRAPDGADARRVQGSRRLEGRATRRRRAARRVVGGVQRSRCSTPSMAQVDISNQTIALREARVRQATAGTRCGARGAVAGRRMSARGASRNSSAAAIVATAAPTNSATTSQLGASWEPDLWGGIRRNIESRRRRRAGERRPISPNARLSVQATLAQNYFLLRVQDAQIALLRRHGRRRTSARCS